MCMCRNAEALLKPFALTAVFSSDFQGKMCARERSALVSETLVIRSHGRLSRAKTQPVSVGICLG